ncbi:MAG: hypothetical protein ABMB14_30160, partial [Myxococcota bacterium]
MQFETAEFAGARTCAVCGASVARFWLAGQVTVCEACQPAIDHQLGRRPTVTELARGLAFGIGAGAVGAAAWYAVRVAAG